MLSLCIMKLQFDEELSGWDRSVASEQESEQSFSGQSKLALRRDEGCVEWTDAKGQQGGLVQLWVLSENP